MNYNSNNEEPIPDAETQSNGMDWEILPRLLKEPDSVARTIMEGQNLAKGSVKLLLAAALCHAVFGFAAGCFGGLEVAAMAAWKAPVIAVFSICLCLPSLYVFMAVLGSPLTASQAFAFASACLGMTGLILVGLAPVAWLFAVSTENLPFVILLTLAVWVVALLFTGKFIQRAYGVGLAQRSRGLKLWFCILMVVTLQMTTVMRPLLTHPNRDGHIITTKKMFFVEHFGKTMGRK